MKQEIKVSVICNVYNHEKYVRDALEGFVSQKTNFPYEVLVHDDASTDNSAEIIREYERKHPDIIKPVYQQENQYSRGIGIMRNFQLPRVKGKYIALCEGDDYWTDPLKLQKQFDFMEKNPSYSLCVCSTEWMNLRTGIRENRCKVQEDMDISINEIILGKKGGFFQTASVFIKAEVYRCFPEWGKKFPIGDYPIWILAALNGKVRMLHDVMTVYRYYAENSWTVRMDNDESRAKISVRMIDGLNALNEATEYRYDEAITQRILRHKYTLALMTHDLQMLKADELQSIYKSRGFLYRASDVIRCKYPKIYSKFMKPLVKVVKSIHGE